MYDMTIDRYRVAIDYDKTDNSPVELLGTAAKAVAALENIDNKVLEKLDRSSEFRTFLENIEEGSIIINLRVGSGFESQVPIGEDAEIGKIIPDVLYLAKIKIFSLFQSDKMISRVGLEESARALNEIIKRFSVNKIGIYREFRVEDVADAVELIQEVGPYLRVKERVSVILKGYDGLVFPRNVIMPNGVRNELLVKRIDLDTDRNVILLVKKPDYLGNSMWDVMYGKKRIAVKITDLDFVMKFHKREWGHSILPGDSIEADLILHNQIGYDSNVLKTTYEIRKVVRSLPKVEDDQEKLF